MALLERKLYVVGNKIPCPLCGEMFQLLYNNVKKIYVRNTQLPAFL